MLYHKRDLNKNSKELLEDKMFLCVSATNYRGILIEEFEGGINRWMSEEEFHKQPKIFSTLDDFQRLLDEGHTLIERDFYYDTSEY